MKKKIKKLELSKETVRRMDGAELREAAGGSVRICDWVPITDATCGGVGC